LTLQIQLIAKLKLFVLLGKYLIYYKIVFNRPSCDTIEMLVKMLDAGMNVARLNFSHGDHKTHSGTLDNLRSALKQRPDITCAVMLDTKGPEIRTGLNRDNKPVDIQSG